MSLPHDGHRILAELLRHAENPGAERVHWWLDSPHGAGRDDGWGEAGPVLSVGVGPGVGVVVWMAGDESFIATGGVNAEPATYEKDEWCDVHYPPRTELPISVVAEVVERFVEDGGRAASVDWQVYDPQAESVTYKGQAADLNP
ncbi:Imm1 family immunity protein [Saccharothrix hoggarensis]|uniref:Imm1 family immunity protein n=1 Tax=Saccharothrix hoggarensis TaxID=913853 RepID=A0ABW3QQA9_9PSEU